MLWGGRILQPDSAVYHDAAQVHKLDLALVLAIAEVESSFRVAAFRPENAYRYLVDVRTFKPFRALESHEIRSATAPADFPAPPGVSRDAEWSGQRASWGLMQVMGGVARELGCNALSLGEMLADPAMAVDLGCRHLKAKLARYDGDTASAIAAYNAGSARREADFRFENQGYVDKVTAALIRHRARLGGAA